MGVAGYVENMGSAEGRRAERPDDRPAWVPAWFPEQRSLAYVTSFATVAFLILGACYFVGLSPLKPFAPRLAPGLK